MDKPEIKYIGQWVAPYIKRGNIDTFWMRVYLEKDCLIVGQIYDTLGQGYFTGFKTDELISFVKKYQGLEMENPKKTAKNPLRYSGIKKGEFYEGMFMVDSNSLREILLGHFRLCEFDKNKHPSTWLDDTRQINLYTPADLEKILPKF